MISYIPDSFGYQNQSREYQLTLRTSAPVAMLDFVVFSVATLPAVFLAEAADAMTNLDPVAAGHRTLGERAPLAPVVA